MDFILVGSLTIFLLLATMAAGIPIGTAFILSGLIGSTALIGFTSALSLLSQTAYHSIATPTWACIPLFILMGAFAGIGSFAARAYKGVHGLTYGLPGSLGVATCFGCAAFGAMSGSSIAATAIFGKLSLPEMKRFKYDMKLAVGCIASAGTFASMIPPSMMFIIYAMFTQTSVGKLFAAGIIPGLMTALVYSAMIIMRVRKNPKLAPRFETENWSLKKRVKEGSQLWPIVLIAMVVLGGMYSGLFTPTEAAAAGALLTLYLAWQLKDVKNLGDVVGAMKESANTTAMLFLINIGALYFSRVLAITRLPAELTMFIDKLPVPNFVILLAIVFIMFLLGMIMVPVGIYALTLPIVYPIIMRLGYDPIWFGVICLKMTEIGAVTPPVGLNVYAMKGVAGKDISLESIFAGVWPFVLCDIIVLVFLLIFPEIATWLPKVLLG
jgi:tripartite ATP-independent transporter DctM subunit